MDEAYYILSISLHRVDQLYQVELSHTDPRSDAQVAPLRGVAELDPAALSSLESQLSEYGKQLAKQLFSDDAVQQRFVQVETAAQASSNLLRILVCIDPSAQELQSLRWELLRHPTTNEVLSTSERVLLSRFMVSRDWRPVKLRARADLTALIAISAPTAETLQKLKLAPVDYDGEKSRIQGVLAGVKVRTLGGPGDPFTLDRLLDELRAGVDIVYLVSHGMFGRRTGIPALVLQDESGKAAVVKAEDLTERIGELQTAPRLMVLASCQSAGDGEHQGERTTAQASLAGRLADAGVPGVVAMQGYISMKTVEVMMPVLFSELLRDGQLDRALAVARGKVRGHTDWWMPVLFTRLLGGQLWYTPGFRGNEGTEVWRRLLKPVLDGKVVPIVGPRLLESAHGTSHETARRLAGASQFPMARHEWEDLPRVTGYMSVKESRYNVIAAYKDQLLQDLIVRHRHWLPPEEIPPANRRPRLGKLLSLVGKHLREDEDDAYRILSELPASVYVTTNFDPLLKQALEASERKPQRLLTRWRYENVPARADDDAPVEPSVKEPLVFHVYGAFGPDSDDSLVLTEDDYFDYLLKAVASQLLPPKIESALVDNSLLFLGFRLTDWHFRVLFRLMMSLPGRDRLKRYCHVAVQLDPDMQTMADVEGTKEYLAAYFGREANIDIFWGSSQDFLVALRNEMIAAGTTSVVEETEEDDDEWDF